MTFSEYKEKKKSEKMYQRIQARSVVKLDEIKEIELHIQYFYDCFIKPKSADLNKDEISGAFDELIGTLDIISSDVQLLQLVDLEKELIYICSQTDFTIDELENLDAHFITALTAKELSFESPEHEWHFILRYLNIRQVLHTNVCFHTSTADLEFCIRFFQKNRDLMVQKQSVEPYNILFFIREIEFLYKNVSAPVEGRYITALFGVYSMGLRTASLIHDDQFITEFSYKHKLTEEKYTTERKRRFMLKIQRLTCGYGEKPLRILWFYFAIWLVFSMIYSLVPSVDIRLPAGISAWEKLIFCTYFFNTTSLSIGYGDLAPANTLSMIIVMINQIFGFVIGGTFIALFLRKIFR